MRVGGWFPEKRVEKEEPRMREEEIMGGPGSVPEFLKEKEPRMREEKIMGGPGSVPEFLKEKPM